MDHVEVLVLGSGGAGLSAALAATDRGRSVLVVERADLVGGTTAVSGGGVWVPGARALIEEGIGTPREDSRAYLHELAGELADPARIDRYLRDAPDIADEIERLTPIRWRAAHYPDYHPELRGGSPEGHCIETGLLEGRELLGDRLEEVRSSPYYPAPLMLREVIEAGGMASFRETMDPAELRHRRARGLVGMGRALVVGLYRGCLDAGVRFLTDARAVEPLLDGQRVVGVRSEDGRELPAGSVVVATGGFEWDEALQRDWLDAPPLAPSSPPYNTGDGIVLAERAGAAVSAAHQAWWYPVVELPDDHWPEGHPIRRLTAGERTNPHSIMVNRSGRRFCNESASYHVVGRSMTTPAPDGRGWANAPAWIVFDRQHRERYRIQSLSPRDPDPDWLVRAEDQRGLAEQIGVDAGGLTETVARFNDGARRGEDPEFGRGVSAHDRILGDSSAAHPCLGTIDSPPYYALEVRLGTIGTKGGLAIDVDGRVLDTNREPIDGLYAGSNAIANVTGRGYPGAGGTLGPAVVSGWTAGATAAREAIR